MSNTNEMPNEESVKAEIITDSRPRVETIAEGRRYAEKLEHYSQRSSGRYSDIEACVQNRFTADQIKKLGEIVNQLEELLKEAYKER